MNDPFLLVHSVFGWLWTAASLMVMSICAWLTRPAHGDPQRHYHTWARWWGGVVSSGCRVQIHIEGREHLEEALRQRAVVIACNHQSFLDIPVLLATLPGFFAFVSKAEVFDVPLLGPYMELCGFIKLKRGSKSGSREALSNAIDALHGGRSVLMFPEGTRTPDGSMLPFRNGAAVLAARAGAPILPVAIDGTFPLLPRHTLIARPGRVTLRAGPLIRAPQLVEDDPAPVAACTVRLHDAVRGLLEERPAPLAVPEVASSRAG